MYLKLRVEAEGCIGNKLITDLFLFPKAVVCNVVLAVVCTAVVNQPFSGGLGLAGFESFALPSIP